MQKFEFLRQPLLGELAMSWRERKKERKYAIYSGHLRLCQQPRAAHAPRSDQDCPGMTKYNIEYIGMSKWFQFIKKLLQVSQYKI